MNLSRIAEAVGGRMIGRDINISGICTDSRVKQSGKLFVCLRGMKNDSHEFARQAVENGASAVLTEAQVELGVSQITVSDTRKAYAIASSVFFGSPQKKLKLIAITGTNGKTTTAYLLKEVFCQSGKKAGYIGTLFYEYGNTRSEAGLTTPDPEVLFELLQQMSQEGAEYIFLEASAHALYLNKLESIEFDAAVLTNVTRDHLDYFGDMETYTQAKKSLFSLGRTKLAVINADDAVGLDILKHAEVPIVSYGLLNPADVFAVDVIHKDGLSFTVNMYDVLFPLHTSLCGAFNVSNILAVCAVSGYFGVEPNSISRALENISVPGRFNVYEKRGIKGIIDYAHTGDGLKKLLLSALDITRGRLITVFGCGGDRDAGKREEMGAIASAYSDYVIITNDNPRTENQFKIAEQIESGMLKTEDSEVILDRESAIKRAVELARSGDVIVLAGKGAEKYMEINEKKVPFSDEEILKKYLV